MDTVDNKVMNELRTLGVEITHKVEYPRSDKKLLDYIVKKEPHTIFIKIVHNLNTNSSIFKELKRFTNFLNMSALVIANKINDDNIIDGVLYIKDKIGIVQAETIHGIAKGEKVYIYEYKGSFYVKIDGEKLKKLRERKGLGLSELAKRIGISIKALRMYEEGLIDMTVERAYRFIEIFDREFEEVLKEVDIFADRIQESPHHTKHTYMAENDVKQKLIKIFGDQGAHVEAFSYLPSDLIVSKKSSKIFISLINSKVDMESAILKVKENKMLSKSLNGIPVNIVNDDASREMIKEIESYGTTLKLSQIAKYGIDLDL